MLGAKLATLLGLTGSAVGVRMLPDGEHPPGVEPLLHHRYCQAVMRARRGEAVLLTPEELACPAAAAAFGWRSLPENLHSGQGLVGFGIVSDPAVARRMFERMPRLPQGLCSSIHLYPLDRTTSAAPDVVLVEEEVEKLMWISLAYLHTQGGERLESSTAVLQATCVDATVVPFSSGRLNFSYGCYGCRDATDLANGEAVLGFPGAALPGIVAHLEFLAQRALPVSRSKKAYSALRRPAVAIAG
jgi:uncharacterized protein (DUF169 family)